MCVCVRVCVCVGMMVNGNSIFKFVGQKAVKLQYHYL